MARVVRKVIQVATAEFISESHRQRRRITCAARPKSMIQPLTAENPHSRITATGAPLKRTPRRIVARTDSDSLRPPRPHRTTASQSDRCSLLSQLRYGGLPITRPGSIAYLLKLLRPIKDFCPLPPGTSAALSNTNSLQLPGSIPGVHSGRSRCNFAYPMPTSG